VSQAGLEAANPAGGVVDLSEEMVKLPAARTAFQTALKLVQTAGEIARHSWIFWRRPAEDITEGFCWRRGSNPHV